MWKWRRLTSNDVIRRFLLSIDNVRLTSFDLTRQTWRFSTIVVENWQFLTIFDNNESFKKFKKIPRRFSTKIYDIRHFNDVDLRQSSSNDAHLRNFTSIDVNRLQMTSINVILRRWLTNIIEFRQFSSKFFKISRFHLKISNEFYTSLNVNGVKLFDIFQIKLKPHWQQHFN